MLWHQLKGLESMTLFSGLYLDQISIPWRGHVRTKKCFVLWPRVWFGSEDTYLPYVCSSLMPGPLRAVPFPFFHLCVWLGIFHVEFVIRQRACPCANLSISKSFLLTLLCVNLIYWERLKFVSTISTKSNDLSHILICHTSKHIPMKMQNPGLGVIRGT